MYKIPFNPAKAADQALQVLIPEVAMLQLRLLWNNREESWHVDIGTNGHELKGIHLSVGIPLLYGLHATSPVPGDFIVLPEERESTELDYDGLGTTFGLYYMLPEDVDTWEAAHGVG